MRNSDSVPETELGAAEELGAISPHPAVADPFWIPSLAVPGRLTVTAARQAVASGVTTKIITSTVQTGWRSTRDGGRTAVFSKGYSNNRVHVYVDARTGQMFSVYRGGNPVDSARP